MVIGIFATLLNLPVKALALIVFVHEIAHAHTHIGQDIDNEKWETRAFAGYDMFIVEGLVQFYTESIAKKPAPRFPDVQKSFRGISGKSTSAVYRLQGMG